MTTSLRRHYKSYRRCHRNERLKRKAFRLLRKTDIEGADVTCWGGLFQVRAAATGKARRKRATKEYLKKRSGERNVVSRIQVQLEEDGGGSTRQSWMETSGLWTMLHWERQGISRVSQVKHL